MNIGQVKAEYGAYQELRGALAADIQQLEVALVSQSELSRDFGITPTVVRRLRATHKVRPIRKSRRRNARVRYSLREVLLAVVRDGTYGTGRIRNGSSH